MAPGLAYPVILGCPFLESNKIVIDHEFSQVTTKDPHYQLLLAKEVAAAAKTPTVLPHRQEETKPGRVLQELKDKTMSGPLYPKLSMCFEGAQLTQLVQLVTAGRLFLGHEGQVDP